MPILDDILDHEVLGREYKRGRVEDKQEGRIEGEQTGRKEGELVLLRRMATKRFGPLPAWAEARLASRSAQELEGLADRLIDAMNLEDLLSSLSPLP